VVVPVLIIPQAVWNFREARDLRIKSRISGVYRVETFSRNKKEEPLSPDFPQRWRTIAISNYADLAVIGTVDERWRRFYLDKRFAGSPGDRRRNAEETKGERVSLDLFAFDGGDTLPNRLTLQHADANVTLRGVFGSDTIRATLRRVPSDSFRLFNEYWW
jgi:hypothetical protein